MSSDIRVLYVAPYYDNTGWSHAAIAYIQALDAAGVGVACRPVKLNDSPGEVPSRVLELQSRKFDRYDAVVQNLLPHQIDYHGGFRRNIALYYAETSHFRGTCWADRLNCMDEAWVCCDHNREASERSGVAVPIRVVPIPCDTSRYERHSRPLPVRARFPDHFLFYTVGEFIRRKNFRALLAAFHLEFDVAEPVLLVIKTTPQGAGAHAAWKTEKELSLAIDQVKAGLKLYGKIEHYKREIVVAEHYTDDEILRLHSSCDCGVFTSFGESWSLPAFDSMAMGKTPIVPDYGGFRQYMNRDCGWMVPVHEEPVFGTQQDTFPDLHTAREEWGSVEIGALRTAMREAYQDRELRRVKGIAGNDRAYDFDLPTVGKLMKGVIGG